MSTLSDLMDFGRVVMVTVHGTAHPAPKFSQRHDVEEVQYVDLDEHGGASEPVAPAGWEYLTGFTGQHGYRGACMHPSEFIGGGLEAHILATPGYYVSVLIDAITELNAGGWGTETESVGWGVLHYVGGEQ